MREATWKEAVAAGLQPWRQESLSRRGMSAKEAGLSALLFPSTASASCFTQFNVTSMMIYYCLTEKPTRIIEACATGLSVFSSSEEIKR